MLQDASSGGTLKYSLDSYIRGMRRTGIAVVRENISFFHAACDGRTFKRRHETDWCLDVKRNKLGSEEAGEADVCIRRARHALKQQDFDAAGEHLRRALFLDDQQPAAHNLLGVLHEIRGDRRAAQQSYREALNLDPKYGPARVNLRESIEPEPEQSFMLEGLRRPDPEGDQ